MKNLILTMLLMVVPVCCMGQTTTKVNPNYVMDAETGELVKVIQTDEILSQTDGGSRVCQDTPNTDNGSMKKKTSVAKVIGDAIKTGLIVGTAVHLLKHRHHHHYHPHYTPYYRNPNRVAPYPYDPPRRYPRHPYGGW